MGKVSNHVGSSRATCRPVCMPGIMQPSGVLANYSRQIGLGQ
jgi:hypothetical protein